MAKGDANNHGDKILTEGVVATIAEKIAFRKPKHVIKNEIEDLIKREIDHSTFARGVERARQYLRDKVNKDQTDLFAESVGLYESIISDEETGTGHKLSAQQRLDLILGLEKKETSPDTPEEKADKIVQCVREMESITTDADGSIGSAEQSTPQDS